MTLMTWLLIELYNALHFLDTASYYLFGPIVDNMLILPGMAVTLWLLNFIFLALLLSFLAFVTKKKYLFKEIAKVAATVPAFVLALLLVQFGVISILSQIFTYYCFGCSFFDPIIVLSVTILGSILLTFLSLPHFVSKPILQPFRVALSILLSLLSLIVTIGFFIALLIFEPCSQEYFSKKKFNQHLKDLCYLRTDTSECPKDASELRAFNPKLYDQLARCAELEYSFDQSSGMVIWNAYPYVHGYSADTKVDSFPDFEFGEAERYRELQEGR